MSSLKTYQKVWALLEANKTSARQLALGIGMDPSYMSKALKGKVGFTLEHIENISKYFNVDRNVVSGMDNVPRVTVEEPEANYAIGKKVGVVNESQLAGFLIRNTALLTVILNNQAEMMAKADGRPVASVLAALESAVQQTEASLLMEYAGQ